MNRKISAQICCGTDEGTKEDRDSVSDESSLSISERDTAVAEWLANTQDSAPAMCDEIPNDDDNEKNLISGHKTLRDSEAYRWLVSVMQRTSRLNGVNPHCMLACREIIARQLDAVTAQESKKQELQRLITSKNQPPLYMACFELEWDLVSFLHKECEGRNPGEVVGQIVTITGDGRSVQAKACRGYLEQVWPTTGSEFMGLVEDLVTRAGQSCKRKSLASVQALTQD